MRLLTFRPRRGGVPRVGILLDGERVLDVGAAAKRVRQRLPFDAGDMLSLIAAGRAALAALRKLARRAAGEGLSLGALRVLAPIPRPRKNVFCVGWNYLEHFEEGARARSQVQEMPVHPAFFTKAPTAVNGPFDPIPLHAGVTEKLDWEVELGIVIGRRGRNIAEAEAMKHIFGYTVINDVSAREVQRQHGQQWFKGKSLDGTCPMGPWIVTADEVPDPQALRVICRVNGVVKQDSNTRHMYFRIPRIIAELSAGLTLEPGDVISTGTPAGVGHARTPPEFMKAGDLLETEVEGIGTLRNRVGA
ncbi:MAG TPA: fumarylacetoacetate hydrolase family protein [Burkholderiales bacterium]|nr:fumarylacetoacetate hydrolase family protein [Burkholderiales bacterium]